MRRQRLERDADKAAERDRMPPSGGPGMGGGSGQTPALQDRVHGPEWASHPGANGRIFFSPSVASRQSRPRVAIGRGWCAARPSIGSLFRRAAIVSSIRVEPTSGQLVPLALVAATDSQRCDRGRRGFSPDRTLIAFVRSAM
jgi:hypothetical protein